MKAKKGNRIYAIEPREVSSFRNDGYDIYDDNGKLVAYGAGKTISIEKYVALKKENARLKDQIDALEEKLDEAKKKAKKK